VSVKERLLDSATWAWRLRWISDDAIEKGLIRKGKRLPRLKEEQQRIRETKRVDVAGRKKSNPQKERERRSSSKIAKGDFSALKGLHSSEGRPRKGGKKEHQQFTHKGKKTILYDPAKRICSLRRRETPPAEERTSPVTAVKRQGARPEKPYQSAGVKKRSTGE